MSGDELLGYRLERLADEIDTILEEDGATEEAMRALGRKAVDAYRATLLSLPWWMFPVKWALLRKAEVWARALAEDARR